MMRLSFHISTMRETYFFLALMSVILTLIAVFMSFQRIEDSARSELTYSNSLVAHSVHNLFDKQALLLGILGDRLLEIGITDKTRAGTLLDAMLKAHPELAGLGLALPSGQLVLTSSNFPPGKLPNLLDNEGVRESFNESLHSDEMVVGRTYYVTALQQWLIPLRKRIIDADGRVIAVMTSGIKFSFLKESLSTQSNTFDVDVTLFSKDNYRRYVSYANEREYESLFKVPVSKEMMNRFIADMKAQIGFNFLTDSSRNDDIVLSIINYQGEKALASLSYDDKYHTYAMTSFRKELLFDKLYQELPWYIVIFLIFHLALYLLVRLNAKSQHQSKKALEFQVMHDPLTKLPNRRYLLKEFDAWRSKHEQGFSAIFIDLDNFKGINDLYGHTMGDRILLEVSSRVTTNFKDCLCVRQGGDEFIILTSSSDYVHSLNLCRSFLIQLDKPFRLGGQEFSLQASLGVVQYPQNGHKLDALLSKADMAMYEAKRLRCGFFFYSGELQEKAKRIAFIERELIHALEREEFFIVYQPQVKASSKEVVGVEALLRWDNPRLGLVPPDEFIAVAESRGLIHEIGLFVFETAVAEFINVCDKTHKNEDKLRLSVNVSVQQLFHPSFLGSVSQLQRRHDCSTIKLMVEVTESLFIEDVGHAKELLLALKKKGIHTSLDDFGTGYSSLAILNGLPIDELKIDKTFVDNILNNHQDLQLIKSIINIGDSLGMSVIAEGVEQVEQVDILNENGCDLFQGYHFSKPLSKADLIAFLLK